MWNVFSNIGDAAVTLPVAALCAGWIALFNMRLALRLVAILAGGLALVGLTKVIYAGWGISLPAEDFRVISGHAMLSTSIWMIAITLQLKWWRLPTLPGVIAGMGIGVLTGVSRLVNGAHSPPEVVVGCLLGVVVALLFLRSAVKFEFERVKPVWPTLSLLLVSSITYGHEAPFERLIETRSPQLHSGMHSAKAVVGRMRYRIESYEAASAK